MKKFDLQWKCNKKAIVWTILPVRQNLVAEDKLEKTISKNYTVLPSLMLNN